jgi:hypothetical protein
VCVARGDAKKAKPMIVCQSCRAENWDGAQFCDECGKSLPRPRSAPRAQSFKPPVDQDAHAALSPQGTPPNNGSNAAGSNNTQGGALGGTPPNANGGDNGSRAVLNFPEASTSGASPARAPSVAGEAQRPRTAPHATLTINRGRSAGKDFPVHEDEAYIGRWDADSGIFPDVDLDADDPEAKVSRRHARITRRGNQYFIEDLGSTNGTFINRGRRLLPGDRQPLNDGDEIIIGKTFLRFHVTK